jgi:hypothetical protein
MQDNTSLQNLHDIAVPAPISWWPLAPGWYVLAGVVALALLAGLLFLLRRHQRNRYRRLALGELSLIRQGAMPLYLLPALLKRTALAAWPREQVASMSGAHWHAFLDQSAGVDLFGSGSGRLLDRLSYGSAEPDILSESEGRQLLNASEVWLRDHQYLERAAR